MKLIRELTESRLVTSKTGYKKYSGRELAEILYLHIVAFRILSCEESERTFMFNYSLKTKRNGSFKSWMQNATDLYLFLLPLFNDDLPLTDSAQDYIDDLTLDDKLLMDWIKAVASHSIFADIYARRLFIRLDRQLLMDRMSHRSIRRLAMNWPDLNKREKQLAVTRLLQIMRTRCNSSDLLNRLEVFAKRNKLEIKNDEHDAEDNTPTLTQASARYRLKEEDGGAAVGTTSADIAPMVVPMAGVQRRAAAPKKRKKRTK